MIRRARALNVNGSPGMSSARKSAPDAVAAGGESRADGLKVRIQPGEHFLHHRYPIDHHVVGCIVHDVPLGRTPAGGVTVTANAIPDNGSARCLRPRRP